MHAEFIFFRYVYENGKAYFGSDMLFQHSGNLRKGVTTDSLAIALQIFHLDVQHLGDFFVQLRRCIQNRVAYNISSTGGSDRATVRCQRSIAIDYINVTQRHMHSFRCDHSYGGDAALTHIFRACLNCESAIHS